MTTTDEPQDPPSRNAGRFLWQPFSPGEPWPSGDYLDVATLPVSESQLIELLGMEPLRAVEEGLGPWIAFGGRLDGVTIELIRHELSPGPAGFILRINSASAPEPALKALLDALGLSASALTWIRDTVEHTLELSSDNSRPA